MNLHCIKKCTDCLQIQMCNLMHLCLEEESVWLIFRVVFRSNILFKVEKENDGLSTLK